LPLAGGNDARDNIKGDQPFLGLAAAINVEGDTAEAKQIIGLALLGAQAFWVFAFQPVLKPSVGCAQLAVIAPHFVKNWCLGHLGCLAGAAHTASAFCAVLAAKAQIIHRRTAAQMAAAGPPYGPWTTHNLRAVLQGAPKIYAK